MALIKTVRDKTPEFGANAYLAETATVIGDVVCGDDCTFWFGCVVRGDVNYIKIGNKVNIQDHVMIHGTFEKAATEIGDEVSIGHRAIIHGCTIHDKVLIGMGAIVMDGAVIESGSIIAAGSVVLEGTRVESGAIYAGVPAKKIKDVDQEQTEGLISRISNSYPKYGSWYKN